MLWKLHGNMHMPGQNEAKILAEMQGAIFKGGGDYPANEFIIGSGKNALLCRYQSEKRKLDEIDQLIFRMGRNLQTLPLCNV